MDFVVGYQKAKWDQILEPDQMRRNIKDLYEEKEQFDTGNNDLSEDDSDDNQYNHYNKKTGKYRDPSVTYFDCMGDVKEKCKINGLKYVVSTVNNLADDASDRQTRVFDDTFKKYERELGHQSSLKYPQFKRFICFLDRRYKDKDKDKDNDKNKNKKDKDDDYKHNKNNSPNKPNQNQKGMRINSYDEFLLYSPPDHCAYVPHNYVPLWFLGASRSCLIPNMEYDGDEHDAANAVHLTVVDKVRIMDKNPHAEYQWKLAKLVKKTKVVNGMDFELIIKISLERYIKIWVHRTDEPIGYKLVNGPNQINFPMHKEESLNKKYRTLKARLQHTNITSESHCKGGMLLLSFHVLASDEIKAYLYYQGQIARFMPEDIMHIFPKLFCQTWNHGANRKWWESGKAKMYYDKIKDKLPDVKFNAFCNEFNSQFQTRPRDSKEEQAQIEKQKNMFLFG